MSGQSDMTIGGGVESMSRVGMGASGGAWPVDPQIAVANLLPAAGHLRRSDRDEIWILPRRRRRLRGGEPEARRQILEERLLQEVGHAGEGHPNGQTILAQDEHMRPDATMQTLASLQPSFEQMGDFAGFDAVAHAALSAGRKDQPRPSRRQFVGHRRRRGRRSDRQQGSGQARRPQAARAHPRLRLYRVGARDHADRAGLRDRESAEARRHDDEATSISIELNEAFASVVLRFMQKLEIPHDKINVNGGAIAMGHPLGATGAMILGTVLDELERRGKQPHLSRSASARAWARRRSSSACKRGRQCRKSISPKCR